MIKGLKIVQNFLLQDITEGTTVATLNVAAFDSGLYFVTIQNELGTLITKKIIKR